MSIEVETKSEEMPLVISLLDVLKHNPKPKHILTTTFTLNLVFFESEVFRELNTHALETASIFTDPLGYSQAIQETSILLQAGQAYRVFPVQSSGSFHPKVWLTHGEKGTLLVAGSGNLTPTGFNGNTEVFDALLFTEKAPTTKKLQEQILRFLDGLQQQMAERIETANDHNDVLGVWKVIIKSLPVSDEISPFAGVEFLHSFGSGLIEKIPEDLMGADLSVTAPYFGGGVGGLQLLQDTLQPNQIHVYPARDERGGIDFSMTDVAKMEGLSIYPSPEWRDSTSFVHAKLYGFKKDEVEYLFCTSANATKGAWQGPNTEAGLFRQVPVGTLGKVFPTSKQMVDHPFYSAMSQPTGKTEKVLLFSAVLELLECRICLYQASGIGPFEKVMLKLVCGRYEWEATKEVTFDDQGQARFQLSDLFPGIDEEGISRHVLRLDIQAKTDHGETLHGSGILHNSRRLSWDALQRKSSNLMDVIAKGEGLPPLGELAEVMTRLRGMLDETVYAPRTEATQSRQVEVEGLQPKTAGTAVWPPMPLDKGISLNMSPASMARMMLLTEYYKNLFHSDVERSSSDGMSVTSGQGSLSADEDEDKDQLSEQEKKKIRNRLKTYNQIVDIHFEKLGDHLATLEVTRDNAPNLWLISFAAFIPLIFIVRRMPKEDSNFRPSSRPIEMYKTFMRWMCQPINSKPIIATSLTDKFNMPPPAEIQSTLLAMVVGIHDDFSHGALENQNFQLMWRNYLHAIGVEPQKTSCDVSICWMYWQKHLEDPLSPLSKKRFQESYAALLGLEVAE